jgi:hypothetical protein
LNNNGANTQSPETKGFWRANGPEVLHNAGGANAMNLFPQIAYAFEPFEPFCGNPTAESRMKPAFVKIAEESV